jgi:hypothetical protein
MSIESAPRGIAQSYVESIISALTAHISHFEKAFFANFLVDLNYLINSISL